MSLLLRTHYSLAKSSLKRQRTRSFLTCLGIAIGVASIVLILSLMGSINRLISEQVKSVGSDLIIVRPSSHKNTVDSFISDLTSSNQFLQSSLTLSDLSTISSQENVSAVAPIATSVSTLQGERTVESGTILGTTAELQKIMSLALKSGIFLKNPEKTDSSNLHIATIGRDLSLELFGTTDSVGQTFTIKGTKFLITGVLSQSDDPINFNNVNLNRAVIIHIDRLKELDESLQIQQIDVKVTTTDALDSTSEAIRKALTESKSGETNFTVAYGDQISHPAGSFFSLISGMLTVVACVSIVVGGIGVMNIMLVAVAERTHEIGIRKAIGATNLNIFLQFLFESLILCFLGSLLGLILGYLLAFLLSIITPFAPFINPFILLATLYISITIGTVFGLYPAIKASRKNPIESLNVYN